MLADPFTYNGTDYNYVFEKFKRKATNTTAGIIIKVVQVKTNTLRIFAVPVYTGTPLPDKDYADMITQLKNSISEAPADIRNNIYWYITNYLGRIAAK